MPGTKRSSAYALSVQRRARKVKAMGRYAANFRGRSKQAVNFMQWKESIRGPIAQRRICVLEYSDFQARQPSAGVANDYLFNLNSIFDPDRSGAGHQPLYRDQLALMYNRYRVFACAYRIVAINTDTAASSYCHVIVFPNNSSVTLTDPNQAQESPGAQIKALCYSAGGPNQARFSGYVNLPKLTGVSKTEYRSDERFQAQMSADPAEVMTLHTVIYSPGTPLLSINTHLRFFVELFDPIQQATS